MGGFYGCRLQRVGHPVSYLLRSDYEHVRQFGWKVESKDGDFELLHADVYSDPSDLPPSDVVILGLKTTSNHLLPTLLSSVAKSSAVVFVLQNGIGMEELVADIVGPDRVIGGCCFLCCNKIGPGHIHHLDYGTIAMGEFTQEGKPAGITERLQAIGNDFKKAGIAIELSEDLRLARWKKLAWNIPFNGLSVILNAETNEIVGDLEPLVRSIMAEIAQAAAADGRVIAEEFIQQLIAYTKVMKPYRTSMKVDFDERRPLEVEAIFGATLRLAESLGVNMPIVTTLYQQLVFIDRRLQGEQS